MAAPSITNCWKYATASGVSGTVNGFATVTADRCAVVGTVNFSAGPASLLISDQLNGAYGIVARDHQGSFCSVGAFVQPALVGGAINLSWASASNGITVFYHEVSAAHATTPTIGNRFDGVTASTTIDSLALDNPSDAEALFLAVMVVNANSTPTYGLNASGSTPSSGWNHYNANAQETSTSFMTGSMVNVAVTSSAPRNHVWSWTPASSWDAASIIVAIRSSATPTRTATPITVALQTTATRTASPVTAALSVTGQHARPASDVAIGAWTTQAGSTSNLFAVVDEVTADDADYVRSATAPSADVLVLGLSSVSAPGAGARTLHYRYGKDVAGAERIDLTVELMEGAAVVQTWTHTDIGAGWTQADQDVTGAISDYSNVRVRLTATQV